MAPTNPDSNGVELTSSGFSPLAHACAAPPPESRDVPEQRGEAAPRAEGEHEAQGPAQLQPSLDAVSADAGAARWTALLDRIPDYHINDDGALAEWSWPGLADHHDHRHIQHLYAVWPLHEINPEERPDLVPRALKALELRGDQNLSAHGSLHRALAAARLKDGAKVYDNLRKIMGSDMLFRSLMTSHTPGRHIYNADAAHALPAVLAEALLCTRPGVLELLPALPEQWDRGRITGIRGRGGIRVHSLDWDLPGRTVTVTVTSDQAQDVTLISRRGTTSVTTSAHVGPSSLGPHARRVRLATGQRTRITVSLPTV